MTTPLPTTPLPADSPRRPIAKLGPGTLVLGSVGTQLDMSCQLTEISFSAEAESEDSEATLCGETIAGARVYAYTMAGNVFQDMEVDGVIDFTWKHAGAEVPFKFVPDAAGTAAVTGRVTIDPLTLGGTVNQKNKSEFEWACVGTPVFDPSSNADTTPTDPGTEG